MLYGLIGKSLQHSFSPRYFREKFEREGIAHADYQLFPMEDLSGLEALLDRSDIGGLNVTIPYKQAIIPHLHALSPEAEAVGAVNCLVRRAGQWWGYNTDVIGFEDSLRVAIERHGQWRTASALILGTGGASKAVVFVLKKWGWHYQLVSREAKGDSWNYNQIQPDTIADFQLIINTTPLGMYPNIDSCPDLPYTALNHRHLLYDLVYNPIETLFLQRGKAQGAGIENGLAMLYGQAEAAWRLWS